MTSNKELEAGAKAIAEDFHLPGGGRKKLSELIAEHLGWFDAAEQRGMSWNDMVRALAAAGVTGKGGNPLSIGTLSSTVWRERAVAQGEIDRPERRSRLDRWQAANQPQSGSEQAPVLPTRQVPRKKGMPPPRHGADGDTDRKVSTSSKHPVKAAPTQSNREVLAFMDRARAVRRRSE